MISGLRITFLGVFLIPSCLAQTGTVTFYSYGATVQDERPGVLPTVRAFDGWLFDGQQRMVHARDGRFVTFRLAAGRHSLTAPLESEKPGKEPVLIDIRDGEHYCFHLYSKVILNDALLYVGLDGKMEQVPCRIAAQRAGKLKRLEARRIDPAVLGEVDAAFPGDDPTAR